MPAIITTVDLGTGLLEVDFPPNPLRAEDYVLDDTVTLSPSTAHDRHDLEFPADLVGLDGLLVATVAKPPHRDGRRAPLPGRLDLPIRQGTPIPEPGTEVTLGRGPVRLRQRTANGRPTTGERTAIGVGDRLDPNQVRAVYGLWIELTLRPYPADEDTI